DEQLAAARNSPVYRYVKEWKLGLPLHPEFRTLPMLFYVPPMLPIQAAVNRGKYEVSGAADAEATPSLSSLEQARVPIRFMANLFTAGNEEIVEAVYRKQIAVRVYKRAQTVGDIPDAEVQSTLVEAGTTPAEAEAIFRLTALPTYEERFVIPSMGREQAVESLVDPEHQKQESGFGPREPAERRW
ncbi:MAG: nitrate reductase subunit beta, partial [Gaiellales bacterium]